MALPFKIITQTPFTAISLAEAKSQCRLMSSFVLDDDYITTLIAVAADAAQEYLHWMTSTGVVTQYVESGGDAQLYGKFITEITEVTGINSDGDTVPVTDYTYNDITEIITLSSGYTGYRVTYSCGASDAQLPSSAKMGMLMLISTMYNNREDFITGLSVEKMPTTSTDLLRLTRHYVS